MITLSLNIGSLIGILGLATFICDIVALYVHRSSDVYRQQKFQDVDLNLLRLETLNSLAEGMVSEVSKRKHQDAVEEAILSGHVIANSDTNGPNMSPHKEKFRRNQENHHQRLYDESISSNNELPSKASGGLNGLVKNHLSASGMKTKQSTTLQRNSVDDAEIISANDRINIMFADEESPDVNEIKKRNSSVYNANEHPNRSTPKIETFL